MQGSKYAPEGRRFRGGGWGRRGGFRRGGKRKEEGQGDGEEGEEGEDGEEGKINIIVFVGRQFVALMACRQT